MRLRCATLALAGAGCVLLPGLARAQAFDQYLSPTIPGYDTLRGLEIPQRPRTEYDPLGIQVGKYNVRPQLDTGVGYDTNVLGTRPSTGSFYLNNAPQVFINSLFGTNSLAANFGLNDFRYTDQKTQSHTDWNASVGGTYQIGQGIVTGTASEIYAHENPTDVNSNNITTPLGFKVTDLRLSYQNQFNYWNVQPNFDYQGYRFDNVLFPGGTVSQKSRDRDDFTGGLTVRIGRIPERSFVVVVQATNSHYIASQFTPSPTQAIIPRPDSVNYEALGGVQYSFSANLQVLLLVGYDLQVFNNRAYSQITSPVAQGVVIWAPTGLTTLTAKFVRTIEDSIGQTTSGVTVTQGGLTVDHEYRRNILLQGRVNAIDTAFVNSQDQTIYDFGASLSYLFNRNMRLTGTYDFYLSTGGNSVNGTTIQTTGVGPVLGNGTGLLGGPAFISANSYNRQVFLLSLRFTL